MATILILSSQVVSGYVGASAATFALQRLGHTVLSVPTILLSNHPGHKNFTASATDPALISNILKTLQDNGKLEKLDATLIGYMPSPEHAQIAASFTATIKNINPKTEILCDPILGDEPKGLYISEETANTIKQALLPLADLITPNHFELQWLTGTRTNNPNDLINAARTLTPKNTLLTSAPTDKPDQISNLLITKTETFEALTPRQPHAPNGTGDLLTALFLGHKLNNNDPKTALQKAVKNTNTTIKNSTDPRDLNLIETQNLWSS